MKIAITIFILITIVLPLSFLGHQVTIAHQPLPDLTVPKVWSINNQICYSLKNAGDGYTGSVGTPVSYYNILYIDGKQVAEDHITILLEPGKQVDRCFKYKFQMTPPQHTIKVCADWKQTIKESNEKNNCWEDVWTKEEDIPEEPKPDAGQPDLYLIDVWYYGDTPGVYTEIRYMLKNKGDADAGPSTTALYIDGAKVGEHRADNIKPGEWRVETLPSQGQCSGTSDEFRGIADFYDEVNESDETNNEYSRTYPCPDQIVLPDLVLYKMWHEGEEEYSYITRQYTAENNIRFRVMNSGDDASPISEARLYINGTWSSTHSIPALDVNEEYEGGFGYIGICSGTSDTIRIVVDPSNTITELDDTNNEVTKVWPCIVQPPPGKIPDLHIRSMWLEPLGDGVYRIGYTIENRGPGYAPYSETGLYVDDVFHVEDYVDRLAPGEQRDEEFWWTYDLDWCTSETDTIRIVADHDDEIEETNETNNDYSLTLECPEPVPAPKPDLVILDVWYESDPGPFPYNLYIRYSIRNQGNAPADPSVTRIHINYEVIGTSDVPALASGETLGMLTFPVRWTPQWDDNHVQICADTTNAVDEITPAPSGELNNCLEVDWAFELSCHDGVQNRDEAEIDCGGSYCPPCNRCDLTTLPSRFDWRDYYTLPPVRNQGSCGSCWAHAAIGAVEGTCVVEGGGILNLSEQYAICEVKGNCDDGGCPHDVLKHARNTGIVDENCQPYLASNSPCTKCGDWRDRLWSILEYHRVSKSVGAMKKALICHGPLSVGSENWLHAIVVVGYDDSVSLPGYSPGCWIIRNSWGLGYGDDLDGDGLIDDPGYGLVPYSGHSHSDIKNYVHYVVGVVSP